VGVCYLPFEWVSSIFSYELYREYKFWAMDSGEWQMNKRTFYQKLEEHGYQKVRHSSGMVIKGLLLKSSDSMGLRSISNHLAS